VLVSVYEGKVALSRESARLALAAGESARADGSGVHRTGSGPDGAPGTETASDDPLLAANANLADTVREYKNRLDAIDAKKKALEKQLAEAKEKLAIALNDGQAPEPRSEFDLTQDDWKELAKDGEVRVKVPCLEGHKEDMNRWAKELEKVGFPPQDAPAIKAAMDASYKRLWATIRPVCVKALQGDAALVDKLGPMTCIPLVRQIAAQNGEDVDEELREVAEIRAGLRSVPSDGGGAVMKIWLAMSGESRAIEQDLVQSFGPQDAHRMVFSDDAAGCWNIMKVGGGPPLER
jgi:hypothetical protein